MKEEKLVLVTNPKFYKIEGISTDKEHKQARKNNSHVIKAKNKVHMELMMHSGYGELLTSNALLMERRQLQRARDRKLGKEKNVRKPPGRRRGSRIRHRVVEDGDDME